MARIAKLQFFKGDYNGVYQRLWIAFSENGNIFKTSALQYFNDVPDIKSTKWEYISNESYSRIDDEMSMIEEINFEIKKINKSNGLKM